ncbi:hypothetical protein HPB49_015046 [Dermacentor silvarum]|uniref:Uncharacterized protein n=1 Tax=Dermacentor silvarum TaxID=543639 RepID=A0ACB8DDU8_DERSI|nr:hypothetical protein HPB49_015046 [Dermacentor silvarum]
MSGDIDTIACALWGRGAPPQNLVGLLIALVNLLVHLPFTDLPVLRDYKLGELRSQYDYVIVGGGSAGCVIANRLSANPDITVLLLEAGGLEEASRQVPVTASYNLGGHDDWAYLTVPQKNACLSFQGQTLRKEALNSETRSSKATAAVGEALAGYARTIHTGGVLTTDTQTMSYQLLKLVRRLWQHIMTVT